MEDRENLVEKRNKLTSEVNRLMSEVSKLNEKISLKNKEINVLMESVKSLVNNDFESIKGRSKNVYEKEVNKILKSLKTLQEMSEKSKYPVSFSIGTSKAYYMPNSVNNGEGLFLEIKNGVLSKIAQMECFSEEDNETIECWIEDFYNDVFYSDEEFEDPGVWNIIL